MVTQKTFGDTSRQAMGYTATDTVAQVGESGMAWFTSDKSGQVEGVASRTIIVTE